MKKGKVRTDEDELGNASTLMLVLLSVAAVLLVTLSVLLALFPALPVRI